VRSTWNGSGTSWTSYRWGVWKKKPWKVVKKQERGCTVQENEEEICHSYQMVGRENIGEGRGKAASSEHLPGKKGKNFEPRMQLGTKEMKGVAGLRFSKKRGGGRLLNHHPYGEGARHKRETGRKERTAISREEERVVELNLVTGGGREGCVSRRSSQERWTCV